MIACCWLLQDGYEVFRNVSQHGKIDIVAVKNNNVTFIDVKSISPNELKCGKIAAPIGRRELRNGIVKLLFVAQDGFCSFDPDEIFFHVTGRYTGERHRATMSEISDKHFEGILPHINDLVPQASGNVSELARLLNNAGITTVTGKAWTPSNLHNQLKRRKIAVEEGERLQASLP